jgi:hypothetical protein
MLHTLILTMTQILGSKKASYSFLATAIAIVLHLRFGVSVNDAILLVSPLGLATAAQAHVDGKRVASSSIAVAGTAAAVAPAVTTAPRALPFVS